MNGSYSKSILHSFLLSVQSCKLESVSSVETPNFSIMVTQQLQSQVWLFLFV